MKATCRYGFLCIVVACLITNLLAKFGCDGVIFMLVKVTDQTHIHCTVILRLVQSNSIPDVKFFDNLILLKVYNSSLNLIGWTLANAGDATLE